MSDFDLNQQERRWRLMLGQAPEKSSTIPWSEHDQNMLQCLGQLYDTEQKGSLARSQPKVNQWLGDIRTYFPSSVVQIMQKDALERLHLKQMLLEPEMLEQVEVDIHLVSTLLQLNHLIPAKTKATARLVVAKLVEELERRLKHNLEQAIKGSLNRSAYTRRPKRLQDIHWHRTIQANLKHWQAEYQTIIAHELHGHPRQSNQLKEIMLCVDQSGSMAPSVIYSSVFAAVLASIRAIKTQMVVFDTAIVDLTPLLEDPVDVLFGTQLGGGTDIAKALKYCRERMSQPEETILVLVSDLCEGGSEQQLFKQVAELLQSGVQVVALLALSDEGAPYYDRNNAQKFSNLGIPTFACTPDQFPELMAKAIQKQDLNLWFSNQNKSV